jgi:hypothetical protein
MQFMKIKDIPCCKRGMDGCFVYLFKIKEALMMPSKACQTILAMNSLILITTKITKI